jgi:hypothetical protein
MEDKMADIQKFTDDEVSGIGIGPEHGVAKERLNALIDKVNGMDTPAEIPYTPTVGADWPDPDPTTVQGALDGLASRVTDNTTNIAAIVDDHVRASLADLPAQTDESEVSGALSGDVANTFVPGEIVIVCTEATGTVAGDGTINVGTSADGDDILSAQALTGLDTAGKARRVPLTEAQYNILANATLYVNVESADSTATTLVLSVFVLGRQFAF